MENFSLRNKIIVMLILPIFVILLMSGETLYLKVKETKSIEKTASYIDLTLKSTKLLNFLQQEKEYSLIFVKSYGNEYKKELKKLRNSVDINKEEFLEYVNSFDTTKYSSELEEITKNIKMSLKTIKAIRDRVDNISISDDELLKLL